MKVSVLKYVYLLPALLLAGWASAQVSTDPPKADEIDPNGTLKITVDIYQLDDSQEYVQDLIAAAEDGEDLYIWTWSPAEHPAGHPLVNGTGDQPWKSSNDSLVMTKEGEGLYSFTMVPTEFYEVGAQEVYEKDIKLLVKPKDGGGYGDPDRKSDDLTIPVDPPSFERNPAHFFPGRFVDNDLVLLYYDNNEEESPGMQGLSDDEVYFYAEATLSDSSVVRIANNAFTVGNFPELQMTPAGNGIFKKYFVPRDFFAVPENLNINQMVFWVQKKTFFSGSDRIEYDVTAQLGCD